MAPGAWQVGAVLRLQEADHHHLPCHAVLPVPAGSACHVRSSSAAQFVFARERAQFVPGGVLDVDARNPALLLAQIFDLARIEHAGRTFRGRRGLEITREFGDLFPEILQRTERGDVEHRHEAAVIVPAGGLDAEAEAGQQAAQHLDHRREARCPCSPRCRRAAAARRPCGMPWGRWSAVPRCRRSSRCGIASPRAAASWILPAATADVAMSR